MKSDWEELDRKVLELAVNLRKPRVDDVHTLPLTELRMLLNGFVRNGDVFSWLKAEGIEYEIRSIFEGGVMCTLQWIRPDRPKWLEVAAKGADFHEALYRAAVIAKLKRGW